MTVSSDISALISWYHTNRRDLPWRASGDPYRIWLSEVMLQQTRVDQALPYYRRFTRRFPDVTALADADIDEVLRLWEGLGYYSRARNLHRAARQIVERHNGRFPDTYKDALALSGIGPYTASAVLSIAFGKPHAVVDGNVIRVVSRLFAIGGDVRGTGVQKEIQRRADGLMDRERPGDFNQAMMELGATVCTPAAPDCGSCPLQLSCKAFQLGRTGDFPWKSPAKKRPHYQIAVGVVSDGSGRLLIARRPEKAMLGGLWEFPGGKQEPGETLPETVRRELREELGIDVAVEPEPFEVIRHAYSHFAITLHAFFANLREESDPPESKSGEPVLWVDRTRLTEYAFPKANRKITEALETYRA
ncbi:A/G-specific adenine glycosylase [Balneolales bacterium ANBcel1]|nr:A/G-specific adenine glycosylase [Balneolales bacterium ANBcel1]